jgi:hypothetical protein
MQIGILGHDCLRPRLWIAGATAQMKRAPTGVACRGPSHACEVTLGIPGRECPGQVCHGFRGVQAAGLHGGNAPGFVVGE